MELKVAEALFLLAGLEVHQSWKLENRYWPDNEHYDELRRRNPWWLLKTQFGMIRIGWRKRVISINWEDIGVHFDKTDIIGGDSVTFDGNLCHAWSYVDALKYLTRLKYMLERRSGAQPAPVVAGAVEIGEKSA